MLIKELKETMENIANKTQEVLRAEMRKLQTKITIKTLSRRNEKLTGRPHQQTNSWWGQNQ